jgi:hypothetical protein
MTQTLDVGERLSRLGDSQSVAPPTSATQTTVSRFGTFAFTFGIAFALLYTVLERLTWPLFTYQPAVGTLYLWAHRPLSGEGPPIYWYGWIILALAGALLVGWIATMVPGRWLHRATVFCCALAALWPIALVALRIYIVDWATFDADFLDSAWVAAAPAFVGAAIIAYYFPVRLAERIWTSWVLIVPISGLLVLGYSLKQYFVR